ncbi:MAG: Tn3 family transposase [Solirubrobacterales bacterium]|nr:Tn3 family transposase [Solirubrobacterales bacterium]
MAIHSQILNCSASEVAAMIEGVMRHATAMNVDGDYVDSHGQSEIGSRSPACLASSCSPGSSRSTGAASTAPTPPPRSATRALSRR